MTHKSPQYSEFAKIKSLVLRKNMTDAEQLLWYYLRANRLLGFKFKRQQPIGNYIVDFVNFQNKLVIEIDGGQHNEQLNILIDNSRTKFLELNGYKVLRFWNNDVINNIEGVLQVIADTLPKGEELLIKHCSYKTVVQTPSPLEGEGWGEGEGNNTKLTNPQGRGGKSENNLLFIPCLNPDGLQNNTRTNANGVDLNRNFPTKNWGEDTSAAGENATDYYGGHEPASEIETKFVIDVIEKYNPKLILTLHAPYKIVNYDGPAQDFAQKISKVINYPVEPSIGYPTPGSFGTYCGVERNIPTITLELDEKISVEQLEQPIFEIFDMLSVRTM